MKNIRMPIHTTRSSEILPASCKEWKVNVRPPQTEEGILVKLRGRPQKAKKKDVNPSAFELVNWFVAN
jgi:hypothetical protein